MDLACVSSPLYVAEMDKAIVRQPQAWEQTLSLALAPSSGHTSQEQDVETGCDMILNQLGIRCGQYYCLSPAAADTNTSYSVFVDSCQDFDEVDYKFSVLPGPHIPVLSVYIRHINSDKYISTSSEDGDRRLVVNNLQRDSEHFRFQRSKYIGRYTDKIYVIIDVSGKLRGQRQYVSAGEKKTVCLETKKPLSAGVKELDSTDSRFFILRPAGAGHNCFESTERPDCFLAYNGSKIFLKHIPNATDRMLGNDPDVVFKIRPCEANPSSG